MEISQARPTDLTAIRQMIRALSAFHGDEAQVTLEWLQNAFFDKEALATAFVAKESDRYLGYAGIVHKLCLHEGAQRFDLQHLYIAEGHRSTGIGRALVAACADHVATLGGTGLTIGTDLDNAGAQAAYRAMGLEDVTGKYPRFWIKAA